eukprot:1697462-Prymnesium_polylepis.1
MSKGTARCTPEARDGRRWRGMCGTPRGSRGPRAGLVSGRVRPARRFAPRIRRRLATCRQQKERRASST